MKSAIDRMIFEIVHMLNQQVSSIWLYGSVVLNDFQLGWSDIDFIAFTNNPITEKQAKELVTLRQSLSYEFPDNPFYHCFEGVIVNQKEYLSNNYTRLVYWGTSGQRITDKYKPDVFTRYELAEYGKLVYGNDNRDVFSIPSREEIVSAIRNHYDSIRKYAVQTDESVYSCGWLLDIARCIYTLRYNDVIGKTQAGIWALNEHIFHDEEALRKTLKIRQQPIKYKGREDIKLWLSNLGATVQQYADVLEAELKNQ